MSDRKFQKMFVFGSLRNTFVFDKVVGRTDTVGMPAVLRQHAAMRVVDKEYPVLRFDPDGEVEGVLVTGLTPNDLARLAYWEDDEYGLTTMVVHDRKGFAHDALVYATSVHESSGNLWSFEDFQKTVPAYLAEVEKWMLDA